MDYNFMFNQSGITQGDPAQHAYWGNQMRDGLLNAFDRAYHGNRAPLIIGNHFESWNGGTYMRAVEQTIKTVCVQQEVHCVSFRQLADWLDAQDPQTLEKLRGLGVGEVPEAGWNAYLTRSVAAAGPPASDVAPSTAPSPGSSSSPALSHPAPSHPPLPGQALSEEVPDESEGDGPEADPSEGNGPEADPSEADTSAPSSPEDASAETATGADAPEALEEEMPEDAPEDEAEDGADED